MCRTAPKSAELLKLARPPGLCVERESDLRGGMKVIGDYGRDGYAHLEALLPVEVTQAFLNGLKDDLAPSTIPISQGTYFADVLERPAYEVYGPHYKPMLFFLWGLTPIVSELTGCDLLPTYNYFRIYRAGDVCLVHSDRPACEHSLSLTLGYSDNEIWDLEFAKERREKKAPIVGNFGSDAFSSIRMKVGDAALYRGVNHRHGRTKPNPNAWSAHLFLHWVDRDGPHRDCAFEEANADPAAFAFT